MYMIRMTAKKIVLIQYSWLRAFALEMMLAISVFATKIKSIDFNSAKQSLLFTSDNTKKLAPSPAISVGFKERYV